MKIPKIMSILVMPLLICFARAVDIDLQQPTATFSQTNFGDFNISHTVGSNAPIYPGWSIYPNTTSNQTAVFETAVNIGYENGTALIFTLSQNHITTFHTLGRFRLSLTTDPRQTFADGLSADGDVTANWVVLDPVSFATVNGTTLSELSDHSLLASGLSPTNDTYIVVCFTAVTGITGFRLEVLKDPALPMDGPGRAIENGNFCLTHFQVSATLSNAGPFILSQPHGSSVLPGANYSMNVVADGSPPLFYQWNFNGSPLSEATNPTLTLSNIQPEQAGNYTVVVSDGFNSVTSVIATLAVLLAPIEAHDILLQQATATFSQSAFGNFSIAHAVGTNAPVYPGWSIYPNLVAQTAAFETANNEGFVNGTLLTFTLSQNHITPEHLLGRFRLSLTTDSRNQFADGLISNGDVTANWIVLDPISFIASNGTVLNELNDHSLLANGSLPANDTYVVTAFTPITGITGFRLETLKDSSLPSTGPGRAVNGNFALTHFQVYAESADPRPVIISQPQGLTAAVGSNIQFNVLASGTPPLFYQWRRDGQVITNATNATLFVSPVQIDHTGEYTVVVTNSFGSITSEVAALDVFLQRTLSLQGQPRSQEGTRVQIPITLISTGEVASVAFLIQYDTNLLRDPQFSWDPIVQNGFNQENLATLGQISATFALSESVPSGIHTIALVDFHLRSVPLTTNTPLALTLQNVSDSSGNSLSVPETIVRGCTQRITFRRIIGDNNANDRLDIGDATVVLRFLAALDPVRTWDASGNDVNQNSNLDSGDVTKILRAVAGIDPQPPVSSLKGINSKSIRKSLSSGSLTITPSLTNGVAGQQVIIQVRMENSPRAIAGTAFTLTYPTNALRLQNSSSYRTGSLVPGGSLTIWNVAPAQSDFAIQNGSITFASSRATSWPTSNGVLAEFTFNVQQGATNQHLWPLTISNGETTLSGFDNQSFLSTTASFIGRTPVGGRFVSFPKRSSGHFEFSFQGDPGARYALEISSDLIQWFALQTNTISASGNLLIQDLDPVQPHRFYRARVVP